MKIETKGAVQRIWLGNVGVEKYWTSTRDLQLPKMVNPEERSIVNHYEAMSLWAAGENDIVILRDKIDSAYLDYISKLEVKIPTIYTPQKNSNQDLSITQLILQDKNLLSRLRKLKESNLDTFLSPYGISDFEWELSQKSGLPLWGVSPNIVKRLNNKVFSCHLNQKLNLKHPDSRICRNFKELNNAFAALSRSKKADEHIVLKEVMGVSGSGIFVFKNEREFKGIMRRLQSHASNQSEFDIIIEKWMPKKSEFNIQITVLPDGEVRLEGIKQLLTHKNGVHLGHIFPPARQVLSENDARLLKTVALRVGEQLYQEGYWGVAGIDAFKTTDDTIIPVVEINTRFNMASYLSGIYRLWGQNKRVLAKSYDFLVDQPLTFTDFTEDIVGADLIFSKERSKGVLVYNFSTVNANFEDGRYNSKPRKARVFIAIIDDHPDKLALWDTQFQKKIKAATNSVKQRYERKKQC